MHSKLKYSFIIIFIIAFRNTPKHLYFSQFLPRIRLRDVIGSKSSVDMTIHTLLHIRIRTPKNILDPFNGRKV